MIQLRPRRMAVAILRNQAHRLLGVIRRGGHNVFNLPDRPLDFLTCPDWLWWLMFSHVATTNRVRPHEFLDAAAAAGFEVKDAIALVRADPAYVADVRPHLLARYQQLPDSELSILQYLLVLQRPAAQGSQVDSAA